MSTPLSLADQFALAQRQYQIALVAFNANKTPENAQAIQAAAQTMLQAFPPARRQSPEYQALVNQTVAELTAVQVAAATFVAPEQEAVAKLKSIDDQIKVLQDRNKAIAEQAKLDVAAVEKATALIVESIHATAAAHVAVIHVIADAAVAVVRGFADVMQGIARGQSALMCPVCFYPDLAQPPREFSICPCCGTEFGVDDYSPSDISPDVIHRELRWQWLERGAPWFDPGTLEPDEWSGFEQIWKSPYWLRNAVSTAAPTERKTVAPSGFVVDARVLVYAA